MKCITCYNPAVSKELFANLKVGDRLPDGSRVVNTRYIKQGAIGVVQDLPEHVEAVRKALENFAASVREDRLRPQAELQRPRWVWYEPLNLLV